MGTQMWPVISCASLCQQSSCRDAVVHRDHKEAFSNTNLAAKQLFTKYVWKGRQEYISRISPESSHSNF